jgi:hypothetical protein
VAGENLQVFEGRYKYFNHLTIQFAQSPKNGVFYSIIDEAKYPLKNLGNGVFTGRQGSRIAFERGKSNELAGCGLHEAKTTNLFARISNGDFPRTMWSARPNGERFLQIQIFDPAKSRR